MTKKLRSWIEAMRLRTLPVSIAGVLAGGACAAFYHSFTLIPFMICLLFAVMAQVVSNFANEYFDYKSGIDRKGRDGFKRGVTEGDISPRAMRNATFILLAIASLVGCTLILWGGWQLIFVGVAIAVFALAYSAGPYPLSRHGLGDVAVILFYGLVPVVFTTYVQVPDWIILRYTLLVGLAIGLMGMNVLIVNNYRDYDDDRSVGKHTTATIFGRRAIAGVYLASGIIAAAILAFAAAGTAPLLMLFGPLLYANFHYMNWVKLTRLSGPELNGVLASTAKLMLMLTIWLFATLAIFPL